MSDFNKVPIPKIRRNWFNQSYIETTTCEMGQLIPSCCMEVYPGDTWKGNTEAHCLFMPLVSPVMHRIKVKTYTFFVPNRILLATKDWETFLSGGKDGKKEIVKPQFLIYRSGQNEQQLQEIFGVGSLFDHLGFPPVEDPYDIDPNHNFEFDLLPFRVYNMIYNEYFRDENLQDEIEMNIEKNIDDSPVERYEDILDYSPTFFKIKRKCWEKDYFGSALPFTQRGDDVYIPVTGGRIEHRYVGAQTTVGVVSGVSDNEINLTVGDNWENFGIEGSSRLGDAQLGIDVTKNLESSISSVNATINDLRTAFAVQRYLETSAKVGYRLKEWLLGHFGETIPDSTIQRPQFLGGSTQPVVISQVLQTSSSDNVTPQGNMSGHGESLSSGNRFKARFCEHGWLMTLVCVVPKSGYFQGLPRKFSRKDRFDYFSPEFQNLGEQAILNKEIYFDWSDPDNNEEVFGYQGRWNELRGAMDHISGDMRTSAFRTWHLNRIFSSTPVLNSEFITIGQDNPSNGGLNRIFAAEATGYSHIILQINNNLKVKSKRSYFAVPSSLNH